MSARMHLTSCETADAAEAAGHHIAAAPELVAELVAALREIADGCISRRPGHIAADRNRTKAEIEEIARAALALADGAAP